MNSTGVRINRFLASAGLGSRRACEEHVLEGRVSINGSVCRSLATRVTPEDDVRVNGRQIHQARHRYLLLHKPAGYVSTRSDRHAARTIFDLLPPEAATLFHVGRLDKESEGLLLLTNDGLFAQNLLHPSRGIDKEYEVTLDQPFTPKVAAALKKGIWMEETMARVESVKQLSPYRIKLVLHQGLKRQIRVMLGILGFKVKRLVRVRLGPIKLHGLAAGRYRDLKKEELEALLQATSASAKKKLPLKKSKNLVTRTSKILK
ncbi:MAG: rRNA pseudouridine synthase [Verrucomicrobia bacterium]|nr:rRNA pseudouridine synthase [Verrucomicrobiota bacterium]